jgi:hypothetical protein
MNLLIPSIDNIVSIQVMNYLNQEEAFQFNIEGENIEVAVPEDLQGLIKFGAGETKNFDLLLTPTMDIQAKLIININWMKSVQYTEKVQKVRDVVPVSKLKEIFSKYTLPIAETVTPFNSTEFIIPSTEEEIRQAEIQLNKKRSGENLSVSIEQIDADVRNLAKKYLSLKYLQKALEYSLQLSNEEEKRDFYYDLIRAHASVDFDQAIAIIPGLEDAEKKLHIIKVLAIEQASVNPERAIHAVSLIENLQIKENLKKIIIGMVIPLNPCLATKFIDQVNDEGVKINFLLNIIKRLLETDKEPEAIDLLKKAITLLKNNQERKTYESLKDALQVLAEVDCPKTASLIIEESSQPDLKEKINNDLFDVIYEMVDEIKVKFEPTIAFSQYFSFNTFASSINENIKIFSSTGGNVSKNLLVKDFNYHIAIVSLFSYDFSIFPTLERIYSDLNDAIAYYIYPSINNHDTQELAAINGTLRQFFNVQTVPNQLIVLNLDFIPYLGKPTIIISSENDIEHLKTKIKNALGESANLHVDNSLFKGGTTLNNLKQVFTPNKCKLVNILLSYEFINDFNAFKTFIQSLI